MVEPGSEKPRLQLLKAVRGVILILILMNLSLFALGVCVATAQMQSKYPTEVGYAIFLAATALVRVIWLIVNGFIQAMTASVMSTKKPPTDCLEAKIDPEAIEIDQRVSILKFIIQTLVFRNLRARHCELRHLTVQRIIVCIIMFAYIYHFNNLLLN